MNLTQQQDKEFLMVAIELAAKGKYSCHPNPRVGCILVADSKIIASGWHHQAGQAHAEVNAIADAKKRGVDIVGATAYVSLEPCGHTGKTPPCVDALRAAGIARVVCAGFDPNPKVAGKGIKTLQQSGIDAIVLENQVTADAAEWLNRGFFKRMREKKTWVMLKIASTMDGRTADSLGESQWITGEKAREDVHRLRAESGAVLTGSGTQQADNPSLNVRIPEIINNKDFKQPLRVLLDSNCQLSITDNIVGNDQNLLVYTTKSDTIALNDKAQVEQVEQIQLDVVLDHLAQHEINMLMVEAGAKLSGAFLEADLVDEIVHYIAPSVIGSAGRGMFDFSQPLALADKKHFKIHSVQSVGDDIKIVYVRNSK